ncbi:LOW QUALITY PROTEIN: hypothetical protein KUF71_012587 [Frankliniella fusca]|uniref:DUF6570 domain-containing protein n=1 Tax=Frankliniella fusca TaxID=407009 RepID=A0AAE1I3P5_9NEOP|nr:LOW QUALITY PROTEIN: hypothetical protein KUF71_012587 [Frankliniella fusca]
MPSHRVTQQYKRQKLEENREKKNEYQRQYRISRREAYNKSQALLMRSRLSQYQRGQKSQIEIRRMRRKNQEAVTRHRQISPETLNLKRKVAKKVWDRCVKDYESAIREYHTHVCNCCGRLFKFSQLHKESKTNLMKKGLSKTFLEKVQCVKDCEESKFCITCLKDIRKNIVPKLSLSNGLDFPVVDEKILKLNRIEERLISARHVFQTLWTVKGPTGQFKTKGGIVNVPVEVDNSISVLPRPLNDSNMIHVRLARKMEYVKDYMSGIVRPKLLFDAAKALVKKPLAIQENITLSINWESENQFFRNDFETDFDSEFYVSNSIHETMLVSNQDVSFTGMAENGLRMAPAEGFRPTGVLFDDSCEYLAFPQVFGGYQMNPMYNDKPIPYADFAKSMAMRYDRRVAERGDLLLFIAKKLELLRLHNNIGICLRKKSSNTNPHRCFLHPISPHVHMLLWLENAPQFGTSSSKQICQFVDSIISCDSNDIPSDLAIIQTHAHSHTCKKKNGSSGCRFDIPYFPMNKTRILHPQSNDDQSEREQKHYRNIDRETQHNL